MNKTVVINKQKVFVSFGGYFDSAIGDFMFIQVMCDIFMPGGEVEAIAVEKEQIRKILEGFKKREALYTEVKKQELKGKLCYLITPAMRYDLTWMEEKKKLPSSKKPAEGQAEPVPEPAAAEINVPVQETSAAPVRKFTDSRRKFLLSRGFVFNGQTGNWETSDFRFPDARVDKSPSDEQFIEDMNRLINSGALSGRRGKSGGSSR